MIINSPSTTMRRAVVTVAAVSTLVLLASCRSGGDPSATDTPATDLTADCVDYQATQGITDDTISIGTSLPVTGPLATAGLVRYGMEAYFEHINETEGGIDGRELELIVRDDGYDPAKTASNVNELINSDGVFATMGILGTAPVLATQQDLQDACVPNLVVATGSPLVIAPEQAWTTAGQPSYTVEANILAQTAIAQSVESVAIISQNDDFGRAYVESMTTTLDAAGVDVVEAVTYDVGAPTIDAEVTTIAASRADAVLVAALGTKCPQILNGIAASGWDPLVMTGTLCTTRGLLSLLEGDAGDGMLSTAWYKSPGDAQWADDKALGVYRDALAEYAPDADPNEDFVLNGWTWAQLFVEILKSAETLDRASVMAAAREADIHVDTMLDGIQYTSAADPQLGPLTSLQVIRYDKAGGLLQFIDPANGDDLAPGETALTEQR